MRQASISDVFPEATAQRDETIFLTHGAPGSLFVFPAVLSPVKQLRCSGSRRTRVGDG
jgi:hypothetical protein